MLYIKEKKPLSLYIHIPFCESKCLYCDFDSGKGSVYDKSNYLKFLSREMEIGFTHYKLFRYEIKSVFIGGGTPTSLSSNNLEYLLRKVREQYSDLFAEDVEYTVEANPNSINDEKVFLLKQYGVNRVSLGLQSADRQILETLGRTHTYSDFVMAFTILRNSGFKNIGVDLMYAIPNQTLSIFEDTLSKVVNLSPEHISCYGLIIEDGTPMKRLIEEGKLIRKTDEEELQMYEKCIEMLKEYGYEQYEISNFAKKNFQSRHNINYWKSGEYLGLGRSAHSFINGKRFHNLKKEYNQLLLFSQLPIAKDVMKIDDESLFEEWIDLRLRMNEGISIDEINSRFEIDFLQKYSSIIENFVNTGHLKVENGRIFCTTKGFEIQNKIVESIILKD